jgi:hypothetical protein
MNNGFESFKKLLVFVMGVCVLITSIYFSVEGFDFKTTGNLWWVGLILALAVTSAQFMFNTRSKDLNWTIVVLGVISYGYSIWSNIMGFYALRETATAWDWMNISGGIFMDVFPETAIAWSLGVIKAGDLVGNLINVINNPERVTTENPNGHSKYVEPKSVYYDKSTYVKTAHQDRLPKKQLHRPQYPPNEQTAPLTPDLDYPDFLRDKLQR